MKMIMDPLQMDDTLSSILKHLDADCLKSCRVVSPLWSEIAARQLFHSHFFRIPSDFRKKVQKNGISQELDVELTQIQNFVETVGNFPNILIDDENLEGDFKILRRLNLRWTKIRRLKLDWRFHLDIEVYLNFLEEMKHLCCPHRLNFLEIPANVNRDIESSPFSVKFATAVQEFCLWMASNSYKTCTVSHLSAIVSSQKDAENLEKLTNKKSRIRILNLAIQSVSSFRQESPGKISVPQLIDLLKVLLETNKNCLKSLRIDDRDTEILPPNLEIPKVPHLDFFHLTWVRGSRLSFSRDFQFSRHFPNLHTVEIKLVDPFNRQDPIWQNLVGPHIEPARTVKKLRIVSPDTIDARIFDTFPEIEELQLGGLMVVRAERRVLGMVKPRSKMLRRLGLDLLQGNVAHASYNGLAATVSGLSEWEVSMMWNQHEYPDRICWLDNRVLVRGTGLLDFPDVEQLFIISKSDEDYSDFMTKYQGFLHKWVFSLLPNLQVKRASEIKI